LKGTHTVPLQHSQPIQGQPAKGKKPRKAAVGQKEMLLPISGKRTKEDKKKVEKGHACSRSEAGMMMQ